jgi:POT family proton-dependent oligopeptide transporter
MDAAAYKNYAAIMALSFLMPIICGYLSDKFAYSRLLLLFSGIWSGLGLFFLFIHSIYAFQVAIASLIVASAFIKTMIPSLLSRHVAEKKLNSDAIFSKLYVFFNCGALFGTMGCSIVGEVLGWNYGFAVAGMAMLVISLLTMTIKEDTQNKFTNNSPGQFAILIQLIMMVLIGASFILLAFPQMLSYLLYAGFILALISLLYLNKKSSLNSTNIKLLIFLMVLHTLFFAAYEQSSLSLMLFTDRVVDRSISSLLPFIHSNFVIPVTFFQTIDPVANIFMGMLFAAIWNYFAKEKMNFSFVSKFCFGLLTIAAAFLVLAIFPTGSFISPWWIILTYLIFVVGEQCVVPIGFSAVSTLSPKAFTGFCMGIWFVAIAISECLAEWMSTAITPEKSQLASLASYQHGFATLGYSIIFVTVILCSAYYIATVLSQLKKKTLINDVS